MTGSIVSRRLGAVLSAKLQAIVLVMAGMFFAEPVEAQTCNRELSNTLSGAIGCLPNPASQIPVTYASPAPCDGTFQLPGTLCTWGQFGCRSDTLCSAAVAQNTLGQPCHTCRTTPNSAPCSGCEPAGPPRPGERVRVTPSSDCNAAVGAPVAVGSGRHWAEPISLIRVDGPWRVPLEFNVYYSQNDRSSPYLVEAHSSQAHLRVLDPMHLRTHFSHTLSEAIVMHQRQVDPGGGTMYRRVAIPTTGWDFSGAPVAPLPGHFAQSADTPPVALTQLFYRTEMGELIEFFRVSNYIYDTFAPFSTTIGEGWTQMSSRRGVPYRMRFRQSGGTLQEFDVMNLDSGIRSRFDAQGRLISRRAATRNAAGVISWFGYSVEYVGNRLNRIDHDSGQTILHAPNANGWWGRLHVLAVGETTATPANEWIDFSMVRPPDEAVGPIDSVRLSTWIRLARTNRYWRFEFVDGPGGRSNAVRAIRDPAGVVIDLADHQPSNSCTPGSAEHIPRALASESPDGRWEIRRNGTIAGPASLCTASGPVADPARGFNPCPSGQIATLDLRQLERNAMTNVPSTCSYNPTNVGGCGAGFTCTRLAFAVEGQPAANRCARYICSTPASDNIDQINATTCPSGCASSSQWMIIASGPGGTHEPIRRLQASTASGVITTYAYDMRGRLRARCIGDSNTTLELVSGSWAGGCPAGTYDQWDYPTPTLGAYVDRPLVPLMHRRRVVIGGATSTVITNSTQDIVTKEITYTEQQAPTIIAVSPMPIAGPTVTQSRGVRYEFDPVTGALTRLFTGTGPTPTANSAEIVFEYFPGTDATNARHRLQRMRLAKSGTGASTQWLDTTFGSYSRLGIPLSSTDASGVTSTIQLDPTTEQLIKLTTAGRTYDYAYDTSAVGGGRLRSITLPTGEGIIFEYNSNFPDPVRVHMSDTPSMVDASGLPTAADIIAHTQSPLEYTRVSTLARRIAGGAPTIAFESRARRDDRARIAQLLNIANPSEFMSITYDSVGRVSRIRDAQNNASEFTYGLGDSRITGVKRGTFNPMTMVVDATQEVSLTYDQGLDTVNTVIIRDGELNTGQAITYVYNGFGELIQSDSVDAGRRQFVYNDRGLLTEAGEPDGTRTEFEYDRAGRISTLQRDAAGMGPSWLRDGQTFHWDAVPSGYTCPAGATCANLAGRLAAVRSQWAFGEFDTMYGYTAAGELADESLLGAGAPVTTNYEYDAAGRLTRIVYPMGTGDSVRYGYGGPNSPTDESQVTSVHADYNGSPWMTPVPRIDRGAGGSIAKLWFAQHTTPTLPTDPSIERVFDANKRLTAVRWRTGDNTSADLGDYAYSYANSGHLSAIVNNAPGGSSMDSQHFAYDNLGRLTCAATAPIGTTCDTTSSSTVARYTYDDFNNRSSSFYREPSGATHTHVFNYGGAGDRTRLRSWRRSDWAATDTMNLTYGDVPTAGYAPGHRASESRAAAGSDPAMARSFYYSNGGRLAGLSMTDARGTSAHYFGYDHLGRRRLAYQILADGSARYEVLFYDVFGRMIGSLATTSTSSSTMYEALPIYWVDNEPVVRLQLESNGGGWSYMGGEFFYNDHTGTPRTTVEFGSNAVRYRASTEPFLAGPARQDTGWRPMQMRFPGQWEDRGTGFVTAGGNALSAPMSALVANHARVYDPGTGAYGQREPMVSEGRWIGWEGVSPWFGYAGWQPVRFIDPDGRAVWANVGLGLLLGAYVYPMAVDAIRTFSNSSTMMEPAEARALARELVNFYPSVDPVTGRSISPMQRRFNASSTLTSVRRGTYDPSQLSPGLRGAISSCRTQSEISDRLAPVAHYLEGAAFRDSWGTAGVFIAGASAVARNNVLSHFFARGLGIGKTGPTEVAHASLFDSFHIVYGSLWRTE
jgi:YD repeat-containing protein